MKKTLPIWDIEEIQDEILGEYHSVPIIVATFLFIFSGFAFILLVFVNCETFGLANVFCDFPFPSPF